MIVNVDPRGIFRRRCDLGFPTRIRVAVGKVFRRPVVFVGAVIAHFGAGNNPGRAHRGNLFLPEGNHGDILIKRLSPQRLR